MSPRCIAYIWYEYTQRHYHFSVQYIQSCLRQSVFEQGLLSAQIIIIMLIVEYIPVILPKWGQASVNSLKYNYPRFRPDKSPRKWVS